MSNTTQKEVAEKLGRDMERMKQIAVLPDIYLKTRSRYELVSLLAPLDKSVSRKSRDEIVALVLAYKRGIRESYRDVKVGEELEKYRKQVTQLIKAIINPNAVSGYNPELDRMSIITRMENADFLDFLKESASEAENQEQEQSIGEAYRLLYEDDREEEQRLNEEMTESLGFSRKLDWDEWRDSSLDSHWTLLDNT